MGFLSSPNKVLYHPQSHAQSERAMYSAIVEDIEIRVCVLECYLTLAFAREKNYPCI